jgi:hypothetical protein
MKKIGLVVLKAFMWVVDLIFEAILSLSEEDDYYEYTWTDPSSVANCYLCGEPAPGHHPKGEMVICDHCREGSAKPS